VFDGTELALGAQYSLFVQAPNSSVQVVSDPAGGNFSVLQFHEAKQNGGFSTGHTMVAMHDKRTNYTSYAQMTDFEKSYHQKQRLYVGTDPQFQTFGVNLLEDNHCEPCEANNIMLMTDTQGNGSVCLWVVYSTDPTFDPRGASRGGTTDPWATLDAHQTVLSVAQDGSTNPSNLPPTGMIWMCRSDVTVSSLQGRWVDYEILVKSSSYATGQVVMWLDGKPYSYNGPNSYRWNQLGTSGTSRAVNAFQMGLYMNATTPAPGTSSYWDIYSTPPRIEFGDDIVVSP
jgi:hypothetical protein